MIKILSVGEVMLELSDMGDGLYKKSFAGDSFNVAYYLNAVAKHRVQVDYLTAVGTDAHSDACLEFMADKGVSTLRCLRDATRTLGLFILCTDTHGEKQYAYWRGHSAARGVFDQMQDLSGYDLVYFSGITAAITTHKDNLVKCLVKARQQGARIAYDFNYRNMLWPGPAARDFAGRVLPDVDIVKISSEELEILYPDMNICELSNAWPDAEWIVTCGGEKAETWCGGDLIAQQFFKPIGTIVDSSAAGDAFIATYIAAKLDNTDPLAALSRAHGVAAQVVCARGSIVVIDMIEKGSS